MTDVFYLEDRTDETQPHYSDLLSTLDEHGHLTESDLFGVQTKIFDITTPMGVTLEKLASDNNGAMIWELPTELKQLLRHVNKTDNRSHVTEADLEGELTKGLFLNATVISQYSSAPIRLAVDIPGLVPQVYSTHGRHNWIIPANCPFTKIDRSIFEPDNMFTRWMYEHDQKCNLKTLNDHIRLDHDKNKQFAVMSSHGVGWTVLKKNLIKPEFFQEKEAIIAKNRHVFEEEHINHLVQVPYDLAEAVYESIAEPLRKIDARYTNFDTLHARITRLDRQPWNSIKGLAMDTITYGEGNVGYELDQKLHQPFEAGVSLEVKYVLNYE